ncbi:SRPBCC family protein [Rhizomonospora bruguierae]|uniref:SRPBCC family protein n=1 Tax=Rhizomonospora bruguierae TaxID=1581705 RepID=UPI001BCD2D65|nr:SRPBCC family protein [Micromonospora sp. NBRC 107566]
MNESIVDSVPLFDLRSRIEVSASPERVYSVVSDLTRSGEWSPECRGGQWIAGEAATVGAVFRGENLRPDDVVAWAPLIRGVWYTECQIVAAEPGRTFRWAMRTHTGENQQSVWGFDIEPREAGAVLTHHFRMGPATEGIRKIVKDLDEPDRKRFVVDWTAKLEGDLAETLHRIKEVIEKE